MSTSTPAKSSAPSRREKQYKTRAILLIAGLAVVALASLPSVFVLGLKDGIINAVISITVVALALYGPSVVNRFICTPSADDTQSTEAHD